MQLFFKGHFQPIIFPKLKDWKLEKCYMRNHTCLLDHQQKSLKHDHNWTKGMINRVLQLNISQLESSFNSLLEKQFILVLPSQPNPNPNPIGDRTVKPVEQENTSCSREIVGKCLQEELDPSDRTGNLWSVKIIASCKFTIERGNLWNHAHTQFKKLVLSNIVTLHLRTRTSSILQLTRKTSTSKSQECRIRSWNVHVALTFTTWFSRSRITLNDKHFKVIFNNIEHSIPSAKNQRMRLKLLGTLNYAR